MSTAAHTDSRMGLAARIALAVALSSVSLVAPHGPASAEEVEAPLRTIIGTGEASWYGKKFAGRPTASGERFRPDDYTAAHRNLPFGALVRVTNLANGKSVVVRINDRGPFHSSRIIDVSEAAAHELGIKGPGSGRVELELLPE